MSRPVRRRGRLAPALLTAGGGGALAAVAVIFGADTLLVPAIALTLAPAVAGGWLLATRAGMGVRLQLDTTEAAEGGLLQAHLEIRRRLPARRVLLCDPLAGEARPLMLPAGRGPASLRVTGPAGRRGRRRLAPAAIRLRDPLEMFELERRQAGGKAEVLILPATERVRWLGPAGGNPQERAAGSLAGVASAALELDGVRPYRTGTSASRMYWPALARGAGLMERALQGEGDRLPLVVLDPRGAPDEEDLDAAVRAAGSIALELAHRGGCRLQVGEGARPVELGPDLRAWSRVHEALALVEPSPQGVGSLRTPHGSASAYHVLAVEAPGIAARPGALVYVLPDRLLPAGAGRPELHVAGCTGLRADRLGRMAA